MKTDPGQKPLRARRRVWPHVLVATIVGLLVGAFLLHRYRNIHPPEGCAPIEFIIQIIEYLALCTLGAVCGLVGWSVGCFVRRFFPLVHASRTPGTYRRPALLVSLFRD